MTLTASYYSNHADPSRHSMISTPHDADLDAASCGVATSIQLIAEVLGAYVFHLNGALVPLAVTTFLFDWSLSCPIVSPSFHLAEHLR